MFEFLQEIALLSDKNKSYLAFAFDGRRTYVSSDDRHLHLFDANYRCIKTHSTYGNYYGLCYDTSRNCLWALEKQRPGTLIKLSEEMEEVEQIALLEDGSLLAAVEALFYHQETNRVLFAQSNKICFLDQERTVQTLLTVDAKERLVDFCLYGEVLLCLLAGGLERYLTVVSGEGVVLERQALVPDKSSEVMLPYWNPKNPLSLRVRFLVQTEDQGSVFVDYKPELEYFSQYAKAYLGTEGKNQELSELQAQQLYGLRMPSLFGTQRTRRCNCQDPWDCCQGDNSYFPDTSCNNEGACESNCSCVSCSQARADIMESIALTEASIAHILNAEGEKLQKAIACSRNVSELLCVNESVLKTIIQTTQLEQMLYNKLESVLRADCCEDCCHRRW